MVRNFFSEDGGGRKKIAKDGGSKLFFQRMGGGSKLFFQRMGGGGGSKLFFRGWGGFEKNFAFFYTSVPSLQKKKRKKIEIFRKMEGARKMRMQKYKG